MDVDVDGLIFVLSEHRKLGCRGTCVSRRFFAMFLK